MVCHYVNIVNIEYSLQKTLGQKPKSASPERLAQCHPDPDSVPKHKHVQPWPVHIGAQCIQCMGSKHAWNAGILAGVWNLSKGSCRVAMVVQCKIWHPLDPKDGCPCAKCAKCALCNDYNAHAFVYKKSILQISHSHDSHVTKVHPAWRPGATDRSLNMLNLPIFQGTKSDTFEASRCGDVVCGLFPHGNSLATT